MLRVFVLLIFFMCVCAHAWVRDCVCTLCVILLDAFSLECQTVADNSRGVIVGVSNSDLNVGYAVGGL